MSEKNEKRIRREIRKQYGKTLNEVANMNARMLKAKPKYVPMFIWVQLLGIFVKIKK